jgi:hypothetical protein
MSKFPIKLYRFFRNRSKSRERSRRSTPPTTSHKVEMTAAQQAHITQFLSASLSGLGPATTVHHISQQHSEPVRTDFSNLFHSISTSAAVAPGPNQSALAIAAAKAKDLLRAKNLTDTMKTASNGNSALSNGNESSRDGELNKIQERRIVKLKNIFSRRIPASCDY